jgi:general secretion pathway protein K
MSRLRPRRHHLSRSDRPRGIALIAVLWLVALLTLLATSAVALSTSHRRAVQRLTQAVELDARTDSAIRVILLRIMAPPTPNQRVPAGVTQRVEVADGGVDVTVERDLGRIDLNTASSALVFAFFAGNGVPEEQAHTLADRIEDWKDTDDTPHERGAERREYAAAGWRYVPRNGAFESVEELRQVLGAADIEEKMLSAFTVYTHAQAPLETVAAEPVKRALAVADERQLDGHSWMMAHDAVGGTSQVSATPPPSETPTLIGEVLRVRACASERAIERCRLAVVRLTGSTSTPMQVFAWNVASANSDK